MSKDHNYDIRVTHGGQRVQWIENGATVLEARLPADPQKAQTRYENLRALLDAGFDAAFAELDKPV